MTKIAEQIASLVTAVNELEAAKDKVMAANNVLLASLDSLTPGELATYRAEVFAAIDRVDAVINTLTQG